MAKYFLFVKTFSRGKGSSATKAAAYRAGERIRDDGLGSVHDFTDRTDVAHAEIVLPTGSASGADMDWARDRSILWNAVQQSGRQWNSRLAREVLVLVPNELNPSQRVNLVRSFSQELANRYGGAVDFAVHEPRPLADERHHHAHMLMTARQVGPAGLGARTALELSGTERHERGLKPSKDELLWIRERWAGVANEALKAAGVTARLDHRSYGDQGLDREPAARIPPSILYTERRLGHSIPAGDAIRARHRERIEARRVGPKELARVVARQRAEGRQHALQSRGSQEVLRGGPRGAQTRDELNAKRRAYTQANSEEINRKQRERRRANAVEVNRKQREYCRKRQAEKRAETQAAKEVPVAETRARDRTIPRAPPPTPQIAAPKQSLSPGGEQSAKNWLAYRENQKQAPAQKVAESWRVYKDRQPPAPSKDAVSDWLAYRQSAGRDASRETTPGDDRGSKDAAQPVPPGRKNDHSL